MMNTRFFVLAAVAVLSVNGMELGASPAEAEQTLKALDLDGSGTVTQEEVQKFAESQGLKVEDVKSEFMQLDKDGDGQLSTEEVMAMASEDSEKTEEKPETDSAVEKEEETEVESEVAPAKSEGVKQDLTAQMKDATADAEKAAGAAVAQKFAKLAALAMAHKAKDEAEANKQDGLSKKLLQEAKDLTKGAAAKAQAAAKDAAEKVVQAAMTQLQDLERQASEAEEKAKSARQAQHEATKKVKKAQKLMNTAVE